MLRALRARTWNLEPHAIRCPTLGCKANLFDLPDGSLLAVVVLPGGGGGSAVKVAVAAALTKGRAAEVLQVGRRAAWEAAVVGSSGTATVPVDGGVAMLRFSGYL